MTVSDAARKLVRQRANFLCEYCHSLEEASAAKFAIDRRGRGAGSGERGAGGKILEFPQTRGFQAPPFMDGEKLSMYFETRSARNTTSLLQAPPFMDGVSPCSLPPAPLPLGDHILPQSLGGSDNPDNLALACQRCNGYRYNFTSGIDPQTQEVIPLFHPRKQKWSDHFIWSADGLRIIGVTITGRATCHRLDLNDERHNEGSIVKARRFWVRGGWHPPEQDPQQQR